VEEKPDVTYNDVGGCKEALEKLREVVELPLLHPEKFVALGIDPPKGILLYGPPGTGKTLSARAVANRTDACFIRVIGSELVQKYVGEGARMVRELFQMARSKKACIVFFDEVDAIGASSNFAPCVHACSTILCCHSVRCARTEIMYRKYLSWYEAPVDHCCVLIHVCMYMCKPTCAGEAQ
jgi:ATP-dependent Zn protease